MFGTVTEDLFSKWCFGFGAGRASDNDANWQLALFWFEQQSVLPNKQYLLYDAELKNILSTSKVTIEHI